MDAGGGNGGFPLELNPGGLRKGIVFVGAGGPPEGTCPSFRRTNGVGPCKSIVLQGELPVFVVNCAFGAEEPKSLFARF